MEAPLKKGWKMEKMAAKAIAVIRQYDYKNGHHLFEVC